MKKRIYSICIVLCFSLSLFGIFFENIDSAFYELLCGKPLLSKSNLAKLSKVSKNKPLFLKKYGIELSKHEGKTYITYWNKVEGFSVHQATDGLFIFSFSESKDSTTKPRTKNTFDEKDANRVIDHIISRQQKERILHAISLEKID